MAIGILYPYPSLWLVRLDRTLPQIKMSKLPRVLTVRMTYMNRHRTHLTFCCVAAGDPSHAL